MMLGPAVALHLNDAVIACLHFAARLIFPWGGLIGRLSDRFQLPGVGRTSQKWERWPFLISPISSRSVASHQRRPW
jgi:hypothetical protein